MCLIFVSESSYYMFKKILYIIFWSGGLLWATFPDFYEGKMSFNFNEMGYQGFFTKYLFPLLMALLLFLFDVIYAFYIESAKGAPQQVQPVMISGAGFILFFILSAYLSATEYAPVFFLLSWLCLATMKYFKTDKRSEAAPQQVLTVGEA